MSAGGFWGPYYSQRDPISTTAEDTMAIEVDQSSGLHIFEVHAPTAGISFFAVVCGLVAIALAYGCYRKCCYMRLFGPSTYPSPPAPTPFPAPPTPAPQPSLEPLLQVMAFQSALQHQQRPALTYEPRQQFPSGRIYEPDPEVVVHPTSQEARFKRAPAAAPRGQPATSPPPPATDFDL